MAQVQYARGRDRRRLRCDGQRHGEAGLNRRFVCDAGLTLRKRRELSADHFTYCAHATRQNGCQESFAMNARTIAQGKSAPVSPRFDRKFIEDHKLLERYLENKLPFKGARDLEEWCREHPDYLNELKLSERAHASLKLLEASGRPQDLGEPKPPWWKSIYVLIGLSSAAFISLIACWVLAGKYSVLQGKLDDTKRVISQGPLVQPAAERAIAVTPDHAPGINRARIKLSRTAPLLMDVHIDLGYTQKLTQFRVVVDKQDQGRALVLNNVLKDSNGELRVTLNSTGLSAGLYTVRIEALPPRGIPLPIGWLILEVQ
jgi:hypothetical protein